MNVERQRRIIVEAADSIHIANREIMDFYIHSMISQNIMYITKICFS